MTVTNEAVNLPVADGTTMQAYLARPAGRPRPDRGDRGS